MASSLSAERSNSKATPQHGLQFRADHRCSQFLSKLLHANRSRSHAHCCLLRPALAAFVAAIILSGSLPEHAQECVTPMDHPQYQMEKSSMKFAASRRRRIGGER